MSPLDHKPPPLLLRPGIKKAVPHSDNYSPTEEEPAALSHGGEVSGFDSTCRDDGCC